LLLDGFEIINIQCDQTEGSLSTPCAFQFAA
jgi:hypothetical protein